MFCRGKKSPSSCSGGLLAASWQPPGGVLAAFVFPAARKLPQNGPNGGLRSPFRQPLQVDFPAGAAAARKHRQMFSNLRFRCPVRPPCGEAAETLPKPACKLAGWSFMAGLSLSLWVLQPLVAGRFLGLGGMRLAYTIMTTG